MATTSKCPYCGGTVSSEEKNCPHCGAANENYIVDTPRQIFQPKTIEELKEYCAERGMPLLRMRFFVGEDFKEPKAFGIYREGDRFVVYKNKADGSRAIRYQGPDEAYAVNELYQKLLSECHIRGIYPDGKHVAEEATRTVPQQSMRGPIIGTIAAFLIVGLWIFGLFRCSIYNRQRFQELHKDDGYYSFANDDSIWYLYGDDWYYSDQGSSQWYSGDPDTTEYTDHWMGTDYDSDWGVTDFRESDTWDSISSSSSDDSSSSSDYDSWDSGGTDWDTSW